MRKPILLLVIAFLGWGNLVFPVDLLVSKTRKHSSGYLRHEFMVNSSSLNVQRDSQAKLIDQQIQELENKKLGYEGRALLHEDKAQQLQFNDESYLEARRHNQLADENRAKAEAIQKEIDRLQAEKDKILSSKR